MRPLPTAGTALAVLCLLVLPFVGKAQCTLECLTGPVIINLGPACSATVQPTQLLGPGNTCTGAFSLIVFDQGGVPIPGNTVNADHINHVLPAQVTHVETGQTCVTTITPVDVIPPVVAVPCPDLTISCNADTAAMQLPGPGFTDNCGPLVITTSDQILSGNCPVSPSEIERTWVATDQSGLTASCVQRITLEYRPLGEIDFPPDITLNCAGSPYNLDVAGHPLLDGLPLESGPFCEFDITFTDVDISPQGPGLRTIQRTWTATNCLGQSLQSVQIITVLDDEDPFIVCPADTTLATDTGFCNVTALLPHPIDLGDSCTEVVQLLISAPFGAGQGPHIIPLGTHIVTYTAVDVLGNTASCTMSLTVEDVLPPTVSCQNISPTLLPSGTLSLPASAFILAQSDNCAVVLQQIRRLDGVDPYAGSVTFSCADVGQEIPLRVRVFDAAGLVDSCDAIALIQDKTPPTILECPTSIVLDCADFTGDVNDYPPATFVDECGMDTTIVAVNDLRDMCGVGEINRTFTAFDLSGNTSTCVQVFSIVNNNELSEDLIEWPADVEIYDCVGPFELIPDSTGRPVVDGSVCSIIGIGYKDETLIVNNPGCLKIIRTWTVIDWCVYDKDDPNSPGIFMHKQMIKVLDNDPPVLNCPDTLPVSVGPNCAVIFANLPTITADDCSPQVLITNNSPFANHPGANASGNYPLGKTTVTFTANDRCGNFSTCKVDVIVSDFSKPTPQCLHGLSTTLGICDDEILVKIPAKAFNQKSHDNCTTGGKLKFSYSADITDTIRMFTCDDLDTNYIEMWVTDEAGNQDYCITYILIQDNMELCPGGKTLTLAGTVHAPTGDPLEGVEVTLTGSAFAQYMTTGDGLYAFGGLDKEGVYHLQGAKNDHPLKGVSTYDLLLIQKHLLGVKELYDPYKLLAADANQSGSISVSDIVLLRKWLLNPTTPVSPYKPWLLLNPNVPMQGGNPFLTPGLDVITLYDLTESLLNLDLLAVKVGDVNGDAFEKELWELDADPRSGQRYTLGARDRSFRRGDQVEWILTADELHELQSLQMALSWDPAVLAFTGVQAGGNALKMDASHFGVDEANRGFVRVSWSDGLGAQVDAQATLFKLAFEAKADGKLSDIAAILPSEMPSEATWGDGDDERRDRHIQLKWSEAAAEEKAFALYPNRPNPFRDLTMIGFRLPEPTEVTLTLFSVDGQVITEFRGKYPDGYHEISVPGELLPPGVILYRLQGPGFSETRKMIRQ